PGFEHEHYRTLSRPRSGHVWIGEATRYLVVRQDAEGRETAVLERRASWFPDVSGRVPTRGAPPRPRISGLSEEDGLLWVYVLVAAPTWRAALPAVQPGSREVSASRIAFEKMYTTSIEVIDPREGRVVARGAYDHPIVAAPGERRAAAYTVRPDGVPVVQ